MAAGIGREEAIANTVATIPISPRGARGTNMPGSGVIDAAGQAPDQPSDFTLPARHQPGAATIHDGFPTVLLTTVGAKTGKERTHVLGGFPDGDDTWLVVASKGGSPSQHYVLVPRRIACLIRCCRVCS